MVDVAHMDTLGRKAVSAMNSVLAVERKLLFCC